MPCDLTARTGRSARSLQRLFPGTSGSAAAWLAEGTDRTWTEVAVELGYFDQSPFIRDFTRAVGMTRVAYVGACRRQAAPVST